MGDLNKNEVYVVVDTPKKAKKLKKVFDMFGERLCSPKHTLVDYKYISLDTRDDTWTGSNDLNKPWVINKTEVSIKELRNVLAFEHLKEGDYVVLCLGEVVKITEVDDYGFSYEKGTCTYPCFKRYATPEEIALLEGKKENKCNESSVNSYINSIITEFNNNNRLIDSIDIKNKEYNKIKGFINNWIYALDKIVFVKEISILDRFTFAFIGHNTKGEYAYYSTMIRDLSETISSSPYSSAIESPRTRLATPQEVESALIEEAKRSYKVGDKLRDVNGVEIVPNGDYVFKDGVLYYGGATVMKDGKWAEVIEVDKFAELKEAHKNGSVIEHRCLISGNWVPVGSPNWNPKYEYRIKPEDKPKVGDVVKAWDNGSSDYTVGKVIEIIDGIGYFIQDGFWWCNAKTLTQQEAIDLLFKK